MRLLIVSTNERLAGYAEFVEALGSLGVEAICVDDLKYCYLSKHTLGHSARVPFPKLLKLVKRFNPDFVIADDSLYAIDMAKLVNRRVLLHMRGLWTESSLDRVMNPSIFVRMYTSYTSIRRTSSLRKVDLILPNSKWLQKQVNQQFPDYPTQVLYVGINAAKWLPSQNTPLKVNHPAVVGAMPFTIHRKISGLLKLTRVIRRMPDVNFYFAGYGPYFNLIKQNSPPNMFLVGRLQELGVKKLMESGDIFVHPSGLDALPRVVKEASLLEKPIVASNIGGIPEIVINNQTGYLCDINDADEWVAKIRFLLENPDIAKLFGRNAREFVIRTFNWRKIAENFLENLRAFHG